MTGASPSSVRLNGPASAVLELASTACTVRVALQPLFQLTESAKNLVDRRQQQYKHGAEFYQGFKSNSGNQSGIAVLRGHMPGTKQNRKYDNNDTKKLRQPVVPGFAGQQALAGKNMDAVSHRLDLQRQQG